MYGGWSRNYKRLEQKPQCRVGLGRRRRRYPGWSPSHLVHTLLTLTKASTGPHRDFEILLHPRVPLLVRPATEFNLRSLTTTVEDDTDNMVTDTSAEEPVPQDPSIQPVVREHSGQGHAVGSNNVKEHDELLPAPSNHTERPGITPTVIASGRDHPSTIPRTPDPHLPTPTARQRPTPDQTVSFSSRITVEGDDDDDDDDEPMPTINMDSDSD